MLTNLAELNLATGEKLTVKLLTCPEAGYAVDVVRFFLEHKPDWVRRIMRQQLRGDYATCRTDKYFVGEIDGRIAGALYYGFAASGVGSFAHVYTSSEHRKKGIARALTAAFIDDFKSAPVKVILSGTGTPWVAEFYKKFGFAPGPSKGSLILMKHELEKTFEEYIDWYFQRNGSITVRLGGMKYDNDAGILAYACQMRGVALQGDQASVIRFHADAVLQAEDGPGVLTVAENANGHLVGWAFGRDTFSQDEGGRILNCQFHPNYLKDEKRFISESVELIHAVN